jgi:hypothetical protein
MPAETRGLAGLDAGDTPAITPMEAPRKRLRAQPELELSRRNWSGSRAYVST